MDVSVLLPTVDKDVTLLLLRTYCIFIKYPLLLCVNSILMLHLRSITQSPLKLIIDIDEELAMESAVVVSCFIPRSSSFEFLALASLSLLGSLRGRCVGSSASRVPSRLSRWFHCFLGSSPQSPRGILLLGFFPEVVTWFPPPWILPCDYCVVIPRISLSSQMVREHHGTFELV